MMVIQRGALCALLGMLAACGGSNTSGSASTTGSSSTPTGSSSTPAGTGSSTGAPLVALTSATYTAAPSSSAQIAIYRSGSTTGTATVGYTTVNGTAQAGTDYVATSGSVTWADGESAVKGVAVSVTSLASGKQFAVALTSVQGQAGLGSPTSATVAIAAIAAATSTAGATPTTSTITPTGVFGIQVKGDKFVSAKDGSPLQIVGTNISGLETGMNWRWASFSNAGSAFWSKVVNWGGKGVNTVRLPLNEASWLNYTCYDPGAGVSHNFYTPAAGGGYTPDPNNTYQASVKKAVADATAAGLYVILDLHWGSPNNAAGQPLCPIGQPGYADADHSLAFWKSVADTFKGNPAVMFELFNEPFGDNVYSKWVSGASGAGPDAITLRDGGAYFPFAEQNNTNGVVHATSLTWHVAGMQAMLDTIRGEGATNVVLSAPIGWAGELETWLATKPSDPIAQLGVAWHLYGYNKGHAAPLAVLTAGYPIVITETFGLGAIGGYHWAASHGIGYTWWGWNDWGGQALAAELNRPPWYASTAP